jgi:hypothetical protein
MKKIGDLKNKVLRIEYGPSSEPNKNTIDILAEMSERLTINYELDEIEFEAIRDVPQYAYPETDRCTMNGDYYCGGSIGVRFANPIAEGAS